MASSTFNVSADFSVKLPCGKEGLLNVSFDFGVLN